MKLDKLAHCTHIPLYTHTHTQPSENEQIWGEKKPFLSSLFPLFMNENCTIHNELWEKRTEDSSKSSHLDHYVAAGLASVSVLVYFSTYWFNKSYTLQVFGVIFKFLGFADGGEIWHLNEVFTIFAGHEMIRRANRPIFEGPGHVCTRIS